MTDKTAAESDFGALFEAHLQKLKTSFTVGDKIEGVITAIDHNSVYVDVGARSDGIIDRIELVGPDGELTAAVGDRIEAFCGSSGGDDIRLTTRVSGSVADASLQDAYEAGIPIEGRVGAERKGGFEVQLANHSAFCPYSQIDLFKQDAAAYIGERFTFLITSYGDDGRNLVVSRRRLLEKERARLEAELKESLKPGDTLEGRVTKLMPFGAFVDLGGVEGLIHVSELSWSRNTKVEDVLSPGQPVTVMLKEVDWEKKRISLSLKHAASDPWNKLADAPEYHAGRRREGVVTQLMPFGAFVELEPGIEGLIHVSRLGAGRRVNSPSEVLAIGDHVEVTVENVDLERRRISLSMDNTRGTADEADADETAGPAIAVGRKLTGVVEGIRDFGVFVRLADGKNGLLHVSQIELRGSSNRQRALFDMFPPDSSIDVVVREINGDRISLTLPSTLEKEAEQVDLSDLRDKRGTDLGSLGDLFSGLKL